MEQIGSNEIISEVIEKYADMVMRICFMCLKNKADAEDVFQDVFLKYFLHADTLQSEAHQKAWLCRVAFNGCKDVHRSNRRRKTVSQTDLYIPDNDPQQGQVLQAVRKLPHAYKQAVYLHYYEGWTVPQIAQLLHQNENTIYTRLRRAKEQLIKKVGEFK